MKWTHTICVVYSQKMLLERAEKFTDKIQFHTSDKMFQAITKDPENN